ncbi:hypothetical protein M885DRAFT_179647 [Pelagophyceae sp. CCMP2097]|nr:hypothetical protein M885DRAFT_179647 [Pelagophyceae sp. CCMP2097]
MRGRWLCSSGGIGRALLQRPRFRCRRPRGGKSLGSPRCRRQRVVVIPKCGGFFGVGYVSEPGAIVPLGGGGIQTTNLAHELGHNFGANHASIMRGGARGAVAWKDSAATWGEYGSPHSFMGGGPEPAAHLYSSLKHLFGWLPRPASQQQRRRQSEEPEETKGPEKGPAAQKWPKSKRGSRRKTAASSVGHPSPEPALANRPLETTLPKAALVGTAPWEAVQNGGGAKRSKMPDSVPRRPSLRLFQGTFQRVQRGGVSKRYAELLECRGGFRGAAPWTRSLGHGFSRRLFEAVSLDTTRDGRPSRRSSGSPSRDSLSRRQLEAVPKKGA